MIRILLADAQCIERTRIKLLCQEMGDFSVTAEAGSIEEVCTALESSDFDMAIIEPDTSGGVCRGGVGLIKAIRSRNASLPILAFSVCNDPKIAKKTLSEGASGYLSKDCDTETLEAAMRKVASGGRFISQDISFRMIFENDTASSSQPQVRLTARELQIMQMFCRGMSLNDISAALGINNRTVSTYKARLMRKMGFKNNVELYRYAIEGGIVSPGL